MSVTGPDVYGPVTAGEPIEPVEKRRSTAPGDVRKGGWFIRITIIVIVILWSIPTLGVLITSFRAEELVNTSGWWTALAHPFRAAEWTLENYREAITAAGFGSAFMNSLAVTIPSTVIPITIASFAAYAFSWMEFKGRFVLFVAVVFGVVVARGLRTAPQRTARRSLIVAGVGVVSIAVFWTGLPVILAAGAATLALDARRRLGRLPGTAIAALVLATLITVSAVWLAFTG